VTETTSPVFDQLFDYRTRLLARLESQPAEAAAMLAAFPEPEWYRPRGPDGRSLHQLAVHVRDVESMAFLPRLRRILNEERPELESFPSHDWTDDDYQPGEPMTHILAGWSQARAEVLDLLPTPAAAAWGRTGFHPPSGQRTLQWWAERIYDHARQHLLEGGAARAWRA
jgi:DinB superfamily